MSTRIDVTDTPERWGEPGAEASYKYLGHAATGELWKARGGTWLVGVATVHRGAGGVTADITDLVVTIPAPTLPTAPGSVVRWQISGVWKVAVRNPVIEWFWTINNTQARFRNVELLDLIGSAPFEVASFPSDEVTS